MDSGIAGLIGAAIGFVGGAVAQVLGQTLTDRRERAARERSSARAASIFAGFTIQLFAMASSPASSLASEGGMRSLVTGFDGILRPMRSTMGDSTLLLALSPDQIIAVFRAMSSAEPVLYAARDVLNTPHDKLDPAQWAELANEMRAMCASVATQCRAVLPILMPDRSDALAAFPDPADASAGAP